MSYLSYIFSISLFCPLYCLVFISIDGLTLAFGYLLIGVFHFLFKLTTLSARIFNSLLATLFYILSALTASSVAVFGIKLSHLY